MRCAPPFFLGFTLLGDRQPKAFSFPMWQTFERVGLFWTAILLAYGVTAVALIIGRRALYQIRRHVFERHGPLAHPAQDQPH